MDLDQLRRFQWAVRATLVLGVAASVSANILHARDNLIAQTIAAWPPLALMLTVELISRIPIYRRALAVVRLLATASIAGIAAYVSYFHMAAVVSQFGELQPNPYLLPISVDGLIVVASVSLVELAGRVRTILDEQPDAHRADVPPAVRPGADPETGPAPLGEHVRSNDHARTAPEETRPLPTSVWPPIEPSTADTPTSPPVELEASTMPSKPLPAPRPAAQAEPPTADPPWVEPPSATRAPAPAAPSLTEPLAGELPPVEPPADTADGPDEDRNGVIDPELAALLPAARAARDVLRSQHRGLTRDSLAAQLRRDGHTIRTSRVSALLNLLRNDEPAAVNGRSPSVPS